MKKRMEHKTLTVVIQAFVGCRSKGLVYRQARQVN